jgi:hypothetical protein
MARHKEKDAEAGGEGLGKLLTRKRLWKDSTGAIVSKRRPEHEKERKRPAAETEASQSRQIQSQTRPKEMTYALAPNPMIDVPISPPKSMEPTSNGSDVGDLFIPGPLPLPSTESARMSLPAAVDDQWPMPNSIDEMPFEDAGFDSYEFLCNASWGAQPSHINSNSDLPYDDIFAPDTGKLSREYRKQSYSLNLLQLTRSMCLSPRQAIMLGCLEMSSGKILLQNLSPRTT